MEEWRKLHFLQRQKLSLCSFLGEKGALSYHDSILGCKIILVTRGYLTQEIMKALYLPLSVDTHDLERFIIFVT